MIYDCFTFFNELDLLEIRLEELKDVVDRFVLVEATKTFSNRPKTLVYQENKDRFSAYRDRIIHVVVDDLPESPKDSWENQFHQRNAIRRGLADCTPEDIIIVSDVDEIPRASAISSFEGEIAFLEQGLYYYRLNCVCTTEKWSVPIILRYRSLTTPQEVRMYWYDRARREEIPTIRDAGWHFSYLGDVESIQLKLNSFSQQDFNTPQVNNKRAIEEKIDQGLDLFGRQQYQWTYTKIDSSYPRCIYENKFRYARYIKGRNLEESVFFDQYSRYRACADLLRALCSEDSTILDVGSGVECLLGEFLPDRDITFLDPLIGSLPQRPARKIAGDAFSPAVDGKQFDWVVSIDTLEHVPPKYREDFLTRLCTLARSGLIVAFPARDAGDAVATDDWMNTVYRSAYGKDYCWLEEHLVNGLPSLPETVALLESRGWKTHVVQNGHTPWMKELLSFTLCGLEVESFKQTVQELSRYFNENLQPFDQLKPGYRQLVVATRGQDLQLPAQFYENSDLADQAEKFWQSLRLKIAATPYAHLRQLEQQSVQASGELAEQSRTVSRLTKELAERNQHVARLELRTEELNLNLAKLNQQMVERDAVVTKLGEDLAKVTQSVSLLSDSLVERDGHINELKQVVQDRTRELSERNEQLSKLSQHLTQLDTELFQARQHIQDMLNSKSWKITGPLRKACDLLGKN